MGMPSSNSMSNLGGLGPQMASSASFNSFGQKAILPSNSMMTPMNINSNNPSKPNYNINTNMNSSISAQSSGWSLSNPMTPQGMIAPTGVSAQMGMTPQMTSQ